MVITNAQIINPENGNIRTGFVEFKAGKITRTGDMKDFKYDVPKSEIINADFKYLTPGLIDAHSHIGMWEDSLGFEGADGNEETDPSTPQLRAIDAINPMDPAFKEAYTYGVTTVVTGPGSANPIGGQLAAVKTYGKRIDKMIVKAPLAVKVAFGENPKTVYNDKNQTPMTRMATAAIIREELFKAKEYMEDLQKYHDKPDEEDRPDFDMKLEALLPVLEKKIPLHAHAHRCDDIFTAIRIAKEFDLDLVIVHCTEGRLIADELKEDGYPALIGPIMTDRSKPELKNQTVKTAAALQNAGVEFAIISDHPETPERYLLLSATAAEGLSGAQALKALTTAPARILGLDDRIGAIKPGMDADMVVWDAIPTDAPLGKPRMVIVDGKIAVNQDKD